MERKRKSPSPSGATTPAQPRKGGRRAPTAPADPRPAPGDVAHEPSPNSSASVAEAIALGEVTLRAWSEATARAGSATVTHRDAFRVPSETVTTHTDPALLPEVPRASEGLFELVDPVARRALELGLATREPSFHVFVAAAPEVMIEEDVVRYAHRFAAGRPTPPDIVYVHDFDHPEAPRPITLPAGLGPTLVQAMDELIEKLRAAMPSIAEADEVKKAQAQLSMELDARNRQVVTDLESRARTLGFGIRSVPGGVQTFPILHGKPVSPEQFDVLDESTKRALEGAEVGLTREVEKAARVVRAQSAKSEAKRDAAFAHAAEELIAEAMKQLTDAFCELWTVPDKEPRRKGSPRFSGADLKAYFERVGKALVDDWDDLIDVQDDRQEGESPDPRDDPEQATRLNRFKANLLFAHEPGKPPPVLFDTNPTYPNLFGYLERRARFGALLTDFTRIRAGSLHKAVPAPAPPDPSRVTRGVLERSGGRLTRRMTLCLEPELARRLVRYCAGVERELSDVTGDAVRAFLDGQGAR